MPTILTQLAGGRKERSDRALTAAVVIALVCGVWVAEVIRVPDDVGSM